jgi:hypothetical protein
MTWTPGLRLLRYRPAPVMVPPVPTLATKWVTRPAVCRHTSGPVVASWAAGLAGLAYWLGWKAPAMVSLRRRATA